MNTIKPSVLFVAQKFNNLSEPAALLSSEFEVLFCASAQEARQLFANREINVIIADQDIGENGGFGLLHWVCREFASTVRFLVIDESRFEQEASNESRRQVFGYLSRNLLNEELLTVLRISARLVAAELNYRAVSEELHEIREKNKLLERLYLTDALSGLPNRRAMDLLAERELRRREKYSSSLALGLIEVRDFENIKRRYLLAGAEKLQRDLATILAVSVRSLDFIGRLEDGHFWFIAPDTTLEAAVSLGQRIQATVEASVFEHKQEVIPVSVRLGIAVADEKNPRNYDELRQSASIALSKAKSSESAQKED